MFCSRVPHPYLSCVAAAFALLNLAEGLYILHIAGVTALGLALFALRTALALWFTARPEQGAYGLLALLAAEMFAPISTPFTAPMETSAFARLASSFSHTGSPTPAGIW